LCIRDRGCGVQGMDSAEMQHLMRERGISERRITLMKHCGIDLDSWLHGFDDTESAILETVDLVRNHPLVPQDVVVKGYIMDSTTGELTPIG
ncbi:MAG: carbonic anhydrase, partial [Alistipes sp.]|nr:carbonic anhydrase [Alistipes sp.]